MRNLILGLFCVFIFACGGKPDSSPPSPDKPGGEIPPCELESEKIVGTQSAFRFNFNTKIIQPILGADETMQLALQDPTLIGGVPADIADWPASVYMRTSNSACSATVVGERVLMSAAHCMANGSSVTFNAGPNKYTARCEHHPNYRGNSTADVAYCLVDRPVTGISFERIATNMNLRVGDTVRLTGYGCIRPGGGGGNDGIFRIGTADVTSVPSGNNFDVVTRGGAALCFGDSGGAAYFEYPDGKREIFGVNSRGNIKNVSYLPALALPAMQNFATEWATKNGVQICGINQGARACRDDSPPPPPKPKWDFKINSQVGCVIGKMHAGHEEKQDSLYSKLKAVFDSFF